MTLDSDHVKIAIAEATGIVLDDVEAAAIAQRLNGYCRAAAVQLARADTDTPIHDFTQAIETAAPRHG